ncbi:MAG TPA: Maf family protein, partial [Puia sp.]
MDRIILASASPRRKQLLEWAEIPFDVIPSDSDETVPDQLSVSEIPVFLASQKAA